MSNEPAEPDPLRRSAPARITPEQEPPTQPVLLAHLPGPSNWADDVTTNLPRQPPTSLNPQDQMAMFLRKLQESVSTAAQKHPETQELKHAMTLMGDIYRGQNMGAVQDGLRLARTHRSQSHQQHLREH